MTEGVDLMQEVSSAIETLLLILCTQESNGNVQALRVRTLPFSKGEHYLEKDDFCRKSRY